jgi:hypothetical protein
MCSFVLYIEASMYCIATDDGFVKLKSIWQVKWIPNDSGESGWFMHLLDYTVA